MWGYGYIYYVPDHEPTDVESRPVDDRLALCCMGVAVPVGPVSVLTRKISRYVTAAMIV